jgi:hypothetical protein
VVAAAAATLTRLEHAAGSELAAAAARQRWAEALGRAAEVSFLAGALLGYASKATGLDAAALLWPPQPKHGSGSGSGGGGGGGQGGGSGAAWLDMSDSDSGGSDSDDDDRQRRQQQQQQQQQQRKQARAASSGGGGGAVWTPGPGRGCVGPAHLARLVEDCHRAHEGLVLAALSTGPGGGDVRAAAANGGASERVRLENAQAEAEAEVARRVGEMRERAHTYLLCFG